MPGNKTIKSTPSFISAHPASREKIKDMHNHLNLTLKLLGRMELGDAKRELSSLERKILDGDTPTFLKVRFRLAIMHSCVLDHDSCNYAHHKNVLQRLASENRILFQWADPWIRLLDSDLLHRNGQMDKAEDIIDKAIKEYCVKRDRRIHFRLHVLGLLTRTGHHRHGKVSRHLEEAGALLNKLKDAESPVRYHIACGAIMGAAGNKSSAIHHLELAEKRAAESGNKGLAAASQLHMAFLYLESGDKEKIRNCLNPSISFMSKHGLSSMETVNLDMLRKVYTAASETGIEPEHVKAAALNSLNFRIEKDFPVVPVLRIKTLGQFTININNGKQINIAGLGNNLRKILSILASSPQKRANTEQIQTTLWPESSSRQGRQRLDTTFNRLKNEIAKAIAPQKIKDYITVRKGQFRLDNTIIDTEVFLKQAALGLESAARGQELLASNHFRRAFNLWNGEYQPAKFSDALHLKQLTDHLVKTIKQCSETWLDMQLMAPGYFTDDINILEENLKFNIDNPSFLRKMYEFHTRYGRTNRTAEFLELCHKTLIREGLEPFEAQKAMDLMWERRQEFAHAPDTIIDTRNRIRYS